MKPKTFELGGSWGDAIEWQYNIPDTENRKARVSGWKEIKPKVDDFIIGEFSDGIRKYKFTDVQYFSDPRDMFNGTIEFVEFIEKEALNEAI